jgi:hypothetical protein
VDYTERASREKAEAEMCYVFLKDRKKASVGEVDWEVVKS